MIRMSLELKTSSICSLQMSVDGERYVHPSFIDTVCFLCLMLLSRTKGWGGGVCVFIDAKCSLIMEESWAVILPCLMSCSILFKLMGTHYLEVHGMETAEGSNVLVFTSDAWIFRSMLLCLAIYQNYILFVFFLLCFSVPHLELNFWV
jgi:hypothetical protein